MNAVAWVLDQFFGKRISRDTRRYLAAFGIAALIGLGVGVIWVIAGILHFHPLW